MMKSRFLFTPDYIEDLHPSEVFVFGSNMNGDHVGGAAHLAFQRFGAVWGVGEGLRGNSYALPTLDRNMRRVSLRSLAWAFKNFFREVDANPNMVFLLTKVGCGIAGYAPADVAGVFWGAISEYYDHRWTTHVGSLPENLVIPEIFYDYMPHPYRANADFNRLNADLLFITKQLQRTQEKVAEASDSEEYEYLQDTLRELESQRNSTQDEIRRFIHEIIGVKV
jgi:hypothetical protein